MAISSIEFDQSYLNDYAGLVGIDEVGRGALAGSVVAASAFVSADFYEKNICNEQLSLIKDSKQLSPQQREAAFEIIQELKNAGNLYTAWAAASVEEIEQFNILGATQLAMVRSLDELKCAMGNISSLLDWENTSLGPLFETESNRSKTLILIDGKPLKKFPYEHQAVVGGDAKSFAIAVASIVAKVTRDRMLSELSTMYPDYGFEKHKGYGTAYHRQQILACGVTDAHRVSFLEKILAS